MSQSALKKESGKDQLPKLTLLTNSKKSEEPADDSLLGTIVQMSDSLQIMRDIIQKSNFIALNASIEAARTQSQSENFTLVADQVRRQAERTEELAKGLGQEILDLEIYALRSTAVRFTDISSDVIDKIDRNLFERNCDCQAWAGFSENVACALATNNFDKERVLESLRDSAKNKDAHDAIMLSQHRLKALAETYQVYLDILLLNNQGIIVSSACNPHLIGDDQSDREFFKQVSSTGQVHVEDMYYSASIKGNTVGYSAPVKNSSGKFIGVLSTRFNWIYVREMIEKLPLDKETRIYIISNLGMLLASSNNLGVLSDNFGWLTAGESAIQGHSGYSIECARNGQLSAWGYCHTYGFGAYPGKGWSAIVSNPVFSQKNHFVSSLIERDGFANRQAADNANADLERVTDNIKQRVKSINTINNETNMLAVNAAIQAGVAGAEGESFSVIASEIGQLARQSENFVSKINSLTEKLGQSVRNTVFMRLGEAAFDTIDKIDRNLFERYCDVQAFAAFDEFRTFLNDKAGSDGIQDLLRRLHQIYEVYHDIYLLNLDGTIVGAAIHRELLGQSQRDRDWFRECVNGNLVVTDLYRSNSINDYTVTFAAPIHDANNNIIGVLTTRFNCNVIYDIMKATIVGKGSQVLLVNTKGTVIGSPNKEGILVESFATSRAFRSLEQKSHGYIIDKMHNDGPNCAVGFSKTRGYLNYKGKGWAILIVRELGEATELQG
jgi:hypothetical protein